MTFREATPLILNWDGKNAPEFAKDLNVPYSTLRRWRVLIKRGHDLKDKAGNQPKDQTPSTPTKPLDVDFRDNTGVVTRVHQKLHTVDEVLDYAKVDRKVWAVDRHIVNSWESASFDKETKRWNPITLFQVKVFLKRDVKGIETGLLNDTVLGRINAPAKALKVRVTPRPPVTNCLYEVSLFDVHLGKLCWGKEVGADYDSSIATRLFGEALAELVYHARSHHIGKVVLPIGNDYFNVDNELQTTTAGTPQQEDGRWQRSFANGVRVLTDAVELLSEIAPVEVITVPGNHDTQRAYYLGAVLEARFANDKNVRIDNSPTSRKYRRHGNCLIGWTHGNEERFENLPLIMAQEAGADWGLTKFREFHCGHFHHKKELVFQPIMEQTGIRVRVIPSLCPPDVWHKRKGYLALRAAESFVWDPRAGCVANYSYHP